MGQKRKEKFITESLARLSAGQEQDRQDRLDFEKSTREFEKSAREMDARLARLFDQQTQLIAHQSERMDQAQKMHDRWMRHSEDFQRRALHLLNLILDRLPPFSQNSN
jgi:hypothetical protein